jgi:hypothetical protein
VTERRCKKGKKGKKEKGERRECKMKNAKCKMQERGIEA